MAEKLKYSKDMNLGVIVKSHPGAEKIIEKYFGKGCFTCPGIKMELLSFGAMMHGIDPEIVLKELNALE
ncbi:MAG: hypothetical protein HW384_1494 [Dehalococcoidia bacterium]|nr:hypothetical protein [Dehalococcoidia bacterium]